MITIDKGRKQLILMFFFGSFILSAQENKKKEQQENKPKTTFTASVEAYYLSSFNDVPSTVTIPAYNNNEFSLGWISAGFKHEGSNYGLQANVAFGPKNDAFFKTSFYTGEESAFNFVRDAFAYYSPSESLTLSTGIFQNFYGYEWDDTHLNQNYSHGYIYSVSSAGFAGVKADYTINDNWSAMLGVFNNLYQVEESNSNKLLALSLAYTDDSFEGALSYLTSKEPDGITLNVLDFVGAVILSNNFLIGYNVHNIAFNDDNGFKGNVFGAALYPLLTLSDHTSIGVRAEILSDEDSYFYDVEDNILYNITASFNYNVGNLKITPEIRLDGSSEDLFVDSKGNTVSDNSFAILGVTYLF